MSLFNELGFDKVAVARTLGQLPDDVNQWPQRILSLLYESVPYMEQFAPSLVLSRVEAEQGAAIGSFVVRNNLQSVAPPDGNENRIRVIVLVRDFKLLPFDVFEVGQTLYPLTRESLERAMMNPVMFSGMDVPRPSAPNVWGDMAPPIGSSGVGGYMNAVGKIASAPGICERLAGTIRIEDADVASDAVMSHPEIQQWAVNCGLFAKLASKPFLDGEAIMQRLEEEARLPAFDVIQVTPYRDGYRIKVSAAPEGVAPQTMDVPAQQAQQVLPPQMLQAADQQGAATVTTVPASPDTLMEPLQPITTPGIYRVMDAQGRELTGWVFPALVDAATGAPTGMMLFSNGTSYALQPQIMGNIVAASTDVPASEIVRGLGVFHFRKGRTIVVSAPYTVQGDVQIEGRRFYTATDQMGQEVQIVPEAGIMDLFATIDPASGKQSFVMPQDACFMQLNNLIQLQGAEQMVMSPAGQPAAPMKTAMMDQAHTRGTVLAASESQVYLTGPVFDKIAHEPMNVLDALFLMGASGVPQDVALDALAASRRMGRPLDLYGLASLSAPEDVLKEASAFDAEALPQLPDQLKSDLSIRDTFYFCKVADFSGMPVDPTTLDAILGIGFMNMDNLGTFVDAIPQLESAASLCAELLVAIRVGGLNVPEEYTSRAMFSLARIAENLRALKEYSD